MKPKNHHEEIYGQRGDGEREETQKFPSRRAPFSDSLQVKDLKCGKRKREENRREEFRAETEKNPRGEKEKRGENQRVVQPDSVSPVHAREKGRARDFRIAGVGGKIECEKCREGEQRKRKRVHREEAVILAALQKKAERGEEYREIRGVEEFPVAAFGEAEGREGFRKRREGKEEEEQRGGERKTVRREKCEEGKSCCTERAEGNLEGRCA